ncbi:MAG: RNA polymerase sigma factor [Verrucomicrobia bacterium]|nr:RNA polymerase sigma factor [Verrucomicrobiota bacterium]
MESDPNWLVNGARNGERDAANQLIELFYRPIYAFLRRLCASDADAADLTQRTFSRVWQALPSFAGRASVASWIHSIAYHVYVDWRRADHHTEPRSNAWWAGYPASGPAPDEVVARTDMATAIYAAVDHLDTDLRDTIHLHYYQDLTLKETADALGIATSTVKYRLRSALAELHKNLASEPSRFQLLKNPNAP